MLGGAVVNDGVSIFRGMNFVEHFESFQIEATGPGGSQTMVRRIHRRGALCAVDAHDFAPQLADVFAGHHHAGLAGN